jgi:hypothetical protein
MFSSLQTRVYLLACSSNFIQDWTIVKPFHWVTKKVEGHFGSEHLPHCIIFQNQENFEVYVHLINRICKNSLPAATFCSTHLSMAIRHHPMVVQFLTEWIWL